MRTTSLVVWGWALALTAGCGAGDAKELEQEGDAPVEFIDPMTLSGDEALLQALRLQGYPTTNAIIRENDIVIDGDMVFSKAELEELVIEKGYFCNGAGVAGGPSFSAPACWAGTKTVHPDVAAKLQINYDLTFFNLSQGWSWGLDDAAYQWSQAHHDGTPSGIYIDALGEHPSSWAKATITVTAIAGRCPANNFACTDGGPRGTNGSYAARPANINIEPGNIGPLDTPAKIRHTLQHELGHTLGFLHPGDGSRISGTKTSAQLDPDGDGVFDTVMSTGALTKPVLEYDDTLSATKKYPKSSQPIYDPNPAAWSWDFCTDEFPCDIGEGDCDTDIQCKGGAVCGQNVGALYGQDPSADLCVPPDRAGDDDLRGFCPASGSSASCATPGCPCQRLEGDCDNDSECGGRLVCIGGNGPAFGKGASWDFCVEPPNAGCSWFDAGAPNTGLCSTSCPCDAGQGDCDHLNQCRSGLVCGKNLGANFGLPSDYDVCVQSAFAVNGTDD